MSNWTKEEDKVLIDAKLKSSYGYTKIARFLDGRTKNAVRHRWEVLRKRIADFGADNILKELDVNEKVGAKILIFDIETSPMVVYSWGVHQQYINPDNVIKDWYVISWAGKWLDSDEILSDVLTPEEAVNGDDKRIVSNLWELFNDADILVAHNCDRFDKKKISWRFVYHNIIPPLSYRTVDTLKVARRYFKATSNKLDFLTKELGIGKKTPTGGFGLWVDSINGCEKALSKMLEYNINDIIILEKLYKILLPWITNHPNLGLYDVSDITICPNCGSEDIIVKEKFTTTSVNSYYVYRCSSCNHVGRTKKKATTKEERKALLSN